MIVVTGASSNHFRPLRHLLASLDHHEPSLEVIIYDLGLTPDELALLAGRHVEKFDFSMYPPHVNFHRIEYQHCYAFKPIVIHEVFERADENDLMLWLDAGDLVHGKLDRVWETIESNGGYTPKDPFKIIDWAHPETLRLMEASDAVKNSPVHYSGVAGFGPRGARLLDAWKKSALDEGIIRPQFWTRKKHRSDQILLSVLLYQMRDVLGYEIEDSMFNLSVLNDDVPSLEKARERFTAEAPPSDWWLRLQLSMEKTRNHFDGRHEGPILSCQIECSKGACKHPCSEHPWGKSCQSCNCTGFLFSDRLLLEEGLA